MQSYPLGLGYILWDLIDLCRTYALPGRSSPPVYILLHHVALLGGGLFSCGLQPCTTGCAAPVAATSAYTLQLTGSPANCIGQPLVLALYAAEVNTVFMLARTLLRLAGWHKFRRDAICTASTWLYRLNLLCFAASFLWARVWVASIGLAVSYDLRRQEPLISAVGTAFAWSVTINAPPTVGLCIHPSH